jgi:hypothetical protein
MTQFIDAQRLASSHKQANIPTGSPQLDDLTGGIKAETLYLCAHCDVEYEKSRGSITL